MNVEAFEHLELIPILLQKIETMEDRLWKLAPPLTTKREVAKYLDVTERTVNNYIQNGYLKDGIHFYRKSAKMLVFIEDAVISFNEKRKKGMIV